MPRMYSAIGRSVEKRANKSGDGSAIIGIKRLHECNRAVESKIEPARRRQRLAHGGSQQFQVRRSRSTLIELRRGVVDDFFIEAENGRTDEIVVCSEARDRRLTRFLS